MATVTSGDGLIYNVTRARMLAGTFRWTDPDKYAWIADTTYTFNEHHKTLADVFAADPAFKSGFSPVSGAFISADAWAGSGAAQFSGEVWTLPIGSLIFTRFFGSAVPAEAGPDKHEMIACLTTFLGGPIYPDGSTFSLTFDQSNGQQGWFRP